MTYDNLIEVAEKENIEVHTVDLSNRLKGLYADKIIVLNTQMRTNAERTCILAEELGHYHTSVGNILDHSIADNRKQEHKARRWAIKRIIQVEQFIDAFNAGVRNRSELAEFLEVTEGFIVMALEHFRGIYGLSYTINEYIIYFDPLYVYKKL